MAMWYAYGGPHSLPSEGDDREQAVWDDRCDSPWTSLTDHVLAVNTATQNSSQFRE